MFRKDKYLKEDKDYIIKFIREHPFATFITREEKLLATHIPVLIEGETQLLLYGHIADSSEQMKYLKDDMEALLIFHGPQSYVSSSWYHDDNISTWDYSAVHVNVRLNLQSQEELVACLKKLVFHFEKDQKNPHLFHDLPHELINDHLEKIRGFWMKPEKIQGIAKFHQGFDKEDIHSVCTHLEKTNDQEKAAVSDNIKKENDINY